MKTRVNPSFAVVLSLIVAAASAFEIDLRMARIETAFPTNESQRIAAQELEKHLALMAGSRAPNAARPVFVIGRTAPGYAAAKEYESHARAVGGKVYFWGDDSGVRSGQRWGTLFAVYGFLEKKLGVKWVEPGDRGIILVKRGVANVEEGWSYRFLPCSLDGC